MRGRIIARWSNISIGYVIPPGARVLEVGCGTGELLAAARPAYGVGIDISARMVRLAREAFPQLHFLAGDAAALPFALSLDSNNGGGAEERFEYVIFSDVVGSLNDVLLCLDQLRQVCTPRTRVVITHYNKLWHPFIALAERYGMKMPERTQNWLAVEDFANLLNLAGFEMVTASRQFLYPFNTRRCSVP